MKLRVFNGFVEYREDDHVAVIPVYPLIGQVMVHVLDATPIIWKEPYSSEPIEEQRRKKILERIIEALRFRGCRVELVKGT
ncbi:MAG: hypothetical protein DMD83_15165 [Candidatus Rokuibacteriota bacterium]|nr:MAG: hypothetical protein DMD83_15165 [Candidatus Rokubacteria bacterium]